MALDIFEIDAQQGHRGTVIWMHGLGASNRDFEDVVPHLQAPHLRFVFPAAPIRAVTINGGMRMPAWYDILTFDDPPLREHEPDVREVSAELVALINQEAARGVPYERIVLAGFSQGAAMTLHTGLRFQEALGGLLCLSGYLLLPETLASELSESNRGTNVMFAHGSMDPVVPLSLGRRAKAALDAESIPNEFHEYPMEHSLCLPEVYQIRDWLKQRLPAESP